MATDLWDTLQLTLSTDNDYCRYIRTMYDKGELVAGYNLIRERRFDHDKFYLPEIVVLKYSDIELEFEVYYENEEHFRQTFTLNFNENPDMEIKIGSTEKSAVLKLNLLNLDANNNPDDEIDDDGRYDAWA